MIMGDTLNDGLRAIGQPPPTLREGDAFRAEAEYRLLRRLGTGGMGEVWHARRVSAGGHGHDVALKFLTLANDEAEQGLAREALRMAELSHDNILSFVDSGHTGDGAYFIAMEYVRGLDLNGLLGMHGLKLAEVTAGAGRLRIPCPIVGFILFMVCRALHHAHTKHFGSSLVGLIHRDVSPGNVLIEEANGFIKLSDFGVAATAAASAAQSGISGKIPYAAPELLYQEPFDGRADIYSLGLVAYELMTGFNPNRSLDRRQNPMGQLSYVLVNLEEPLVPPDQLVNGVDPRLSQIVLKMLERDPEKRYRSADSVMDDLRIFLYAGGIGPTTDGLAAYLKLQAAQTKQIDDHTRSTLVFLGLSEEGTPLFELPWELTDQAKAKLREGENPARG